MVFIAVDGWYVGELLEAGPAGDMPHGADDLGRVRSLHDHRDDPMAASWWRNRTIRHDQIHDALPMPDWLESSRASSSRSRSCRSRCSWC
jgi:hypothetical protein